MLFLGLKGPSSNNCLTLLETSVVELLHPDTSLKSGILLIVCQVLQTDSPESSCTFFGVAFWLVGSMSGGGLVRSSLSVEVLCVLNSPGCKNEASVRHF